MLKERAYEIQKAALLAEKNIPAYAKHMPGVADALRILRETLDLVHAMAICIERIEARTDGE